MKPKTWTTLPLPSALILFCFGLLACQAATINVPSTITGVNLWTANNTYVIPNPCGLESTAVLDIEAGTNVRFEAGAFWTISGLLRANGLPGLPVQFSSLNPGSKWGGVVFSSSIEPVFDASNEYVSGPCLRHVTFFEGASTGSGVLRIGGTAAPYLEGLYITSETTRGIVFTGSGLTSSLVVLDDSSITSTRPLVIESSLPGATTFIFRRTDFAGGSGLYGGIYTVANHPTSSAMVVENCTFTGGNEQIYLRGSSINPDLNITGCTFTNAQVSVYG